MRKSSFLVLLIIFSLFSPLGGFLPGRRSHAQTKSSKPSGNKLAESLRERVRQSAAGSSSTVGNATADLGRGVFRKSFAGSGRNLDVAGVVGRVGN